MKNLIYIILILVTPFVSCDKRSTERGNNYLPDMQESQAYDTYSENPNFTDSMTMRLPVKGTVPRNVAPYYLVKTKLLNDLTDLYLVKCLLEF